MKSRTAEWIKKTCVVCGIKFEYIKSGYEPKTCDNFDCTHKYINHKEKYLKDKAKCQ